MPLEKQYMRREGRESRLGTPEVPKDAEGNVIPRANLETVDEARIAKAAETIRKLPRERQPAYNERADQARNASTETTAQAGRTVEWTPKDLINQQKATNVIAGKQGHVIHVDRGYQQRRQRQNPRTGTKREWEDPYVSRMAPEAMCSMYNDA